MVRASSTKAGDAASPKTSGTKAAKKASAQTVTTLVAKDDLIQKYQKHNKDTGSAHVQVALLTSRINKLTEHLQTHTKDNHSRRGLIQMVAQRRKLLEYLKGRKLQEYQKLIEDLGLRK